MNILCYIIYMKARYTALLTTVCIFCALSFSSSGYAQTDKVLKHRPDWIGKHYSLENSYLDVIVVHGKLEDLGSLETKALEIAVERRKGAVGDKEAWVKVNKIGTPYYSRKEGCAYFLFQTGESPGKSHKTWEKIDVTDKYPFSARVFVPGMAQIYKGSPGKGSGFIMGEVLFIGGIVATEFMRVNYLQQVSQTHKMTDKNTYAQNARICAITRNACIGGAVALYLWNIIDGAVAKGREHIQMNEKVLAFHPYLTSDHSGIAMNLKF